MRMRFAMGVVLGLLPVAAGAACPGYSVCPVVNYPRIVARNAGAQAAKAAVAAQESATLAVLANGTLSFGQLLSRLGQALVFDASLSVRRNEACAFCHGAATGFAGGVAAFGPGGGVFPGALPQRAGLRAPQSLAYAGFAPVLSLDAGTGALTGGNFWDMRATGLVTGSPAADQALVPLTSPFELALPDAACAVRRVQLAPYGVLFGKVWGANSFAIAWPKDVDARCGQANDGAADQTPLRLSASDRAQADASARAIGLTIAAYEQSVLASPFSAKFDAAQAGQARFSAAEAAGYKLFTGAGHCSACHTVSGTRAMFTNFAAANVGVPRNPALPFLTENVADPYGYVANPVGPAFVDTGVGGFLASAANTNTEWQAVAGTYMGAFAVPTLRNVAAGRRNFMHNGVFHDLRSVVHFFNTRDVLPRCNGSDGFGVTCWPAPEVAANENVSLAGNLGLSAAQEQELVAFLGTLTD